MDQLALAGLLLFFQRPQRALAVLQAFVEEAALLAGFEQRQERLEGGDHVADHAEIDGVAAAQVTAIAVDLDQGGLLRIELRPGEVGAEQQEGVALGHHVEAGLDPEHTGHAHVEGVVVLDEVLGPRRVRDGRLEAVGEGHQQVVGALAAGAGVDADLLAVGQQAGDVLQFGVAGAQHRLREMHRERQVVLHRGLADVGRQDHHRHAAPVERRLAGQGHHPASLFRAVHLLAEHRAAGVDRLEVDLLGKLHAQLRGDDLAGDQDHRRAVALGLVDAVDEVQAARSAGAGAGGQASADVGLGARGEGRRFFVAHVDPLDLAAMDGVGDMVEGVADDAIAMADAGGFQGFHDDLGDFLARHEAVLEWNSLAS